MANGNGANGKTSEEKKNGNGDLESRVVPHEKNFDIFMEDCLENQDYKKFAYDLVKRLGLNLKSESEEKYIPIGETEETGIKITLHLEYGRDLTLNIERKMLEGKKKLDIELKIAHYKENLHYLLYPVLNFCSPKDTRAFFYENAREEKIDLPKNFNQVMDQYETVRNYGMQSLNHVCIELRRRTDEEIKKNNEVFNNK